MIDTIINYFAVTREISRAEDLMRSFVAGVVAAIAIKLFDRWWKSRKRGGV